jgi:hypothetical protein
MAAHGMGAPESRDMATDIVSTPQPGVATHGHKRRGRGGAWRESREAVACSAPLLKARGAIAAADWFRAPVVLAKWVRATEKLVRGCGFFHAWATLLCSLRLTCVTHGLRSTRASGASTLEARCSTNRTACPSRPTASRRGSTPLGTLRTGRFSQRPVQCFEHARACRPQYTRAPFHMKHLPVPFKCARVS